MESKTSISFFPPPKVRFYCSCFELIGLLLVALNLMDTLELYCAKGNLINLVLIVVEFSAISAGLKLALEI
jgi:hypothetical protein